MNRIIKFFLQTPPEKLITRIYWGVRERTEYAVREFETYIFDRRYFGKSLNFPVSNSREEIGGIRYESTGIWILRDTFKQFSIRPDDVIVDAGCGTGRVLAWMISRGYRNRMIGIEIDEKLAKIAERALNKYPNVSIVQGDIIENLPEDATLFYLFNPFKADLMRNFRDSLKKTYADGRSLRVVYLNAQEIDLFRADPDWLVREIPRPKSAPWYKRKKPWCVFMELKQW